MRPGALRVLAWYVTTRAALLGLLAGIEHVVLMDPRNWLIDLDAKGAALAMPEYPWPAVLLLDMPLKLGVPTILHYFAVVVVFFLTLDAAFTWMLWRAAGRRPAAGVWLWVLVPPALGPLVFARFDLLPAFLAAAALLAVRRAPASGGVLASLGAALKLWPAVMLPALLLPGERAARVRVLAGFFASALVLALVTATAAGWARLWSPFAMQGGRGLHLEAFSALPLLWARYLDDGSGWTVSFAAACHCHEISGPGTGLAVAAGSVMAFAGAAFIALLYVRAFAMPVSTRTPAAAGLLAALSLLAWVVAGKVFSPQYLLWVAAPLAVAGVLSGAALGAADIALMVAAAALTHFVYPLAYEALVVPGHVFQGKVLTALALRDALVLAVAARLALRCWRASAQPGGGAALPVISSPQQ
jgi:hypothetical protein